MLQAININMAVEKNSTKAIDPFWVQIPGRCGWDNASCLDELKGVSLAESSLISNAQRITLSCKNCLRNSVSEENLDMLLLQVSTDIQTSLNQFLSPEISSS